MESTLVKSDFLILTIIAGSVSNPAYRYSISPIIAIQLFSPTFSVRFVVFVKESKSIFVITAGIGSNAPASPEFAAYKSFPSIKISLQNRSPDPVSINILFSSNVPN